MTDKNTRGRASKVDLLPPNIKTQLAMMLRDKHLSQAQILEEINDLIRDCGLDDSYQLSRTGLNRYASRMEQMASKIRNAREVAIQRLEQAESLSHKREQAIRKEMAQLAAETAEKVVVQAGLSADTVRTIKEQILGIA